MPNIMEETRRNEIKEIIEFFRGKPVTNEVLTEYCNRRKYVPIVLSDYEDYLFQYGHDERFTKIIPLIMAEMQNIQQPPEFANQIDRKKVFDANERIELNIAKIFEDSGILYSEGDTIAKNLGVLLQGIMTGVSNRVNNMGIATMMDITEKQLGRPLTIKACAQYFRKEADALAHAEEK